MKSGLRVGGAILGIVAAAAAIAPSASAAHPSGSKPGHARTASADAGAAGHAATGVGSCTLKNWNPRLDPAGAKNLPQGQRPQTYKPDDYNCTGARFAANGAEFARFRQPHDFHVRNRRAARSARACPAGVGCHPVTQPVAQAAQAPNPLAPYFPPFTRFVIIYRENHTFDDYLGDCATTIQAGCNGAVQGTNHISSVPNLHALAKTYALMDAYSTGTQPPSGPNHWWLFSAQSSSSSQQQSYPAATGTVFDRFLKGPSGGYPFIMNGDFYWMLNTGSGYWRNPATNAVEALPVNRPGTSIPEELNYNHYTCCGQNDPDQTIGTDYLNFVTANGLPTYSYVELFNDHPGTYQDIPKNDAVTKQIVDSIMNNAAYKDNTLIVVTEDDTQNGSNGPDHVSNTYRVPTVVIASPTYMKQHYVTHVAYSTNNVLAAMERVTENVHPGVIDPNNNIGPSTYPMTTGDQAGLGDPLSDLWIQGTTPLSATASGTPTTGNAPLSASFTGSATGAKAPYSYSWSFGDGSAASPVQNPSHTYNAACTCTATLTVTDSSAPAKTAMSSVAITVSAVGNPLVATASATSTSGQVPLNVAFTGTGAGGTPAYSYGWNFGDGSAASTLQNPSHAYNSAGTYTATLTVTDRSTPAKTATSSVTITASPIAGTAPGGPTGLTASAGSGQASLSWTAPASNGGVSITSYKVYRGTSTGAETLLTSGGCGGLGAVLTCTDSGLTNGQTYFYKVSAVNSIGEGAQSNEANATPSGGTCTTAQLLGNPGFETGTAGPWTATTGVVSNNSSQPPHAGSWDAWIDGYGTSHTDTLAQAVTVPSGCSSYSLSYWLHIDTAETTTTAANDTLAVEVLNPAGTVIGTLASYSNLGATSGYVQKTLNLAAYAGQTVTLKLTGTENASLQTSFVLDDFALGVSGGGGTNTVSVMAPGNQTGTVGTAASLQMKGSDSASGQTLTYAATGLPVGLSINSSTGLISGTPTVAGTATVTVTATDTTGAAGTAAFTWTIAPGSGGCTPAQLLGNPGFETGTASPWTASSSVISNNSTEPPHSGSWDAWLDGYGSTHTDTLAQTMAIPAGCATASLSFWLHVDTAETTIATAYDTLQVQILNSSGTVLSTLHTYSNLDHAGGYAQRSFSLTPYIGQTVTLKFVGAEDYVHQTSFAIDDAGINVS